MKRRIVGGWIVGLCCACSSAPPAAEPERPKHRPRATWTASNRRTPPPPAAKLAPSEPRAPVEVTVEENRGRAGWRATSSAAGQAPPGEVTGYDLQHDPDPHCPGWVPAPRYKLELPPEPEGESAEAERAGLPAGHDLTLPPPPERDPEPAAPPPVKETLRPTEVGR